MTWPEVNVLLMLAVAEHPSRDATMDWLATVSEDLVVFCRITQIGLCRLLINVSVMNGRPLTASQAWKVSDTVATDRRLTSDGGFHCYKANWVHLKNNGETSGSQFVLLLVADEPRALRVFHHTFPPPCDPHCSARPCMS